MANDINMWNDIEALEKFDKQKAEDLHKVYVEKFINFDDKKAEEEKERFVEKYGDIDNYF